LLDLEKKYEILSNENSENKINLIRNGRILGECEYSQKSLEMQVDLLT